MPKQVRCTCGACRLCRQREALREIARENITLTCRDLEAAADRLEAANAITPLA